MGLSVSWFALRADRPGFGRPAEGSAFGVTDDSQVVSKGSGFS